VIDDDAVDMRNFQHSAIFIYVIEDRDDLFDFQQNVKKFNNRLMHIINRTSVVKSDNYSLTIRFIPAEYQRVPVDSFETGAYKITKLNAKSQNLDHIFDWFINQSNRKNRMNFVIGYELKFDSYDDDSVTDILYDLQSINHASCVYLNSLVKNNVRNMFYFDNFPLRVHNNGYKIKTDSLEKFVDKFDKQSRRLNNIKKGYEIPEHFLDGLSDRVREKYMKILQNSRVVIRESQSLLKIEFKYEVSASVMVLIM
jgi:hypothetical protein